MDVVVKWAVATALILLLGYMGYVAIPFKNLGTIYGGVVAGIAAAVFRIGWMHGVVDSLVIGPILWMLGSFWGFWGWLLIFSGIGYVFGNMIGQIVEANIPRTKRL